MNTKLVYVLTCAPDKNYIEQAHISIFSARHHNPDAHIVLIIDKKTDALLVGHRADLLQYLTEKIVIEVPDEYNVMQASRWLKTSVRNIIDGDFLFIDCDTVITCNLSDIDKTECEIGAVLDCHTPLCHHPQADKNNVSKLCEKCGWDKSIVDNYTSSGVIYVKDNSNTHAFFQSWHNNWKHSSSCGVNIDQISFSKANSEYPLVSYIDDVWNTIMFMRPSFIYESKIIHFAALDNNSFLFSDRVLKIIQHHGLSDYLKEMILSPHYTYIPFIKEDYCGKNFLSTLKRISKSAKQYGMNIDNHYENIHIKSRFCNTIKRMYRHEHYFTGTLIWMLWIKAKHKYGVNSI